MYMDCNLVYKDLYLIISKDEIRMKLKSGSFEKTLMKLESIGELFELLYFEFPL